MMNRFWLWVYRKTRNARDAHTIASMNQDAINAPSGPSFNEGMHFHLHEAENGKILQVFIPYQNNQPQFGGGMNPRKQEQKTYIIPADANVIEFITRALVEERIK